MTEQLQNQRKMRGLFGNISFDYLPGQIKKFGIGLSLFLFLFVFSPQLWAQSLSEDFEGGIPSDWGLFLDGAATQNWDITTDGYNSNGAAFLDPKTDNIGNGNLGKYYLVSPQVEVPENAEIRFMAKYDALGDANTTYRVMVSTAPQPDIEDFLNLMSWTGTELANYLEYNEGIVELPAGISPGVQIFIAFVVENTQVGDEGSGSSWSLDNVRLLSGCLDMNPDDVSVDNITVEEADITWTHPAATNFGIVVVEEGEEMDENDAVFQNSTSYHADGLEAETSYDVYIQSVCEDDIAGGWVLVTTFETSKYGMSCEGPIVLGDSYSFSGNIMDFPNSFDLDFDTPGSNCLGESITQNYLNGNRVYFSFTPEQDGLINIDQMTLPFTPGTQCYGNSQSAVLIYDGCDEVGIECMAAIRTTAVNQTEYLNNFPVEAGHTYIIVISTIHASEDASVCFNFNFDFTTCPTPSEISYGNLLQNSVSFTWDNPFDLGDQWEYAVLPVDDGEPTGNGTLTDEHENVLIDGLDANETYNFFVRSLCGADYSSWSDPFVFTTQCETYDLTYYTNFTTGSSTGSEPCWSILDLNNDNITWSFLGGWDGIVDAYASIVADNNQNFNHDYLVSPQIIIPDDDAAVLLSYKHQVTAWSTGDQSSYSVKLSTTGVGEENFTYVIQPTTIISNTAWEEVIYELPEGVSGPVNIAWIIEPAPTSGPESQSSFRLSFADVRVYQDCSDPTDLDVLDVTETSALLTWTPADESDTQWEVVIKDRGEEAPTDQETGTLVDTFEYWAEGLADSTRFEFYVRTACSETARSGWVGPFEFHTLCTPVMEPYYETFNEDIDQMVDPETRRYCWDLADANQDGQTWEFTSTYAKIDVAAGGNDDWLISPAIILDGDYHKLEFRHRGVGGTNYGLEVMISDTDMDFSSFTELFTYEDIASGPNYINELEYFEASGTVYLAFRVGPEQQLSAGQSLYIDDFILEKADACPNPTNIQRDPATNTFTWTPGNNETQWEVALLQEDEFFPTNGEMVYTNSYTVYQDLEEGTEYKFFVRAICDTSNTSVWSGPLKFTTDCSQVFDAPFLETFENDSESLNCWTPNAWFLQSALNPYEGSYVAEVFTWGSASDRWLISPTINVQEGMMLSFYYKASQYAPSYTEDLKVWLSTTGNAISNFTELVFEVHDFGNTSYLKAMAALPEGVSGNINIAFEIPTEISNEIGFRQNTFIDNVAIDFIPECPAPFNVEIVSVSDTEFQIGWDSLDENADLEVLVLPYGTQNPFDNIDPDNIHLVTTNPGTVSGLDPATAYDVYVRSACADDVTGDWSELIPVVTMCDFEDQCLYTITLHSGDNTTGGIAGGIDVMQNGFKIQTLEFPTACFTCVVEPIEYQVYLCDGVEFSLYWDSLGWAPNQYPQAWVKIENSEGEELWMSPMGIGAPKSTIFSGTFSCSDITCEQPTDLSIDEFGVLTWTPGGSETQWEVYIQPYGLGALPSQGIIVDEPTYTPTADDLINGVEGVYEYFVRAICGDDNNSFWTGPKVFILNDDSSNGLDAPVNDTETCIESLDGLSFIGSSASSEPLSLDIPLNSGDFWINFVPTSPTHHIELGNFPGPMNDAGYPQFPEIIMVLYKENGDGSLEELGWSDNNVLRTMYSMEVVPGENYKIRLININEVVPNEYTFSMCITTILDPCNVNTPNYSFENPGMISSYTTEMMVFDNVVPGWRDNSTVLTGSIFFWGTQNDFFPAYHSGQMIQVPFQDTAPEPPAHDAENVYGLYQDFNTEEISQFEYSFAHRRRIGPVFDDPSIIRKIQLYAGPVGGPYQLVKEEASSDSFWHVAMGTYDVPEGQDKTRFIFRSKEKVGFMVLDEVNFIPNNKIETVDHFITCLDTETTLKAEGFGEWSADENNPGTVSFDDASAKKTNVSGFSTPGEYVFYWNTRYCQNSVTITYYSIEEVPVVESPVEYCMGEEALPLTAEEMTNYTLVFFTEEDGEGVESLTPDTSEAGTTLYYVAYQDATGCVGDKAVIEVVVNELTEVVVEFSYEADIYCVSEENPQPVFVAEYTEGGTFSAVPEGLSIDSATGVIDLASSESGVYEVTYSVEESPEDCQMEGSFTVSVEISESINLVVDFTYGDGSHCVLGEETLMPEVTEGFTEGGIFSSSEGLAIDPETGAISLNDSQPGVYEITYTIEADADACQLEGSHTTTVEILEPSASVVDFDYGDVLFCAGTGQVFPEFSGDFTTGGQFTSVPEGLAMDTNSGAFDLSDSNPGVYEITYTVENNVSECLLGGNFTVVIEVAEPMISMVEFFYPNENYCGNETFAEPVLSEEFTYGGSFTSSSGIVLDSETGVVDINASTPGTYEITYTVEEDLSACQLGASYTVSILIGSEVTFGIDTYCEGGNFKLKPVFEDGEPSSASYIWTIDGQVIGNSSVLDFTSATAGDVELPVQVALTINTGGCEYTQIINVTNAFCTIPEGISPNGDGYNDSFNLTGMGVKYLTLYNRYGLKVYSKANYTNEWAGQSDNGKDLPTGTYYYVIETSAGESIKGWVYLNRNY